VESRLTPGDKLALLAIARDAIRARLAKEPPARMDVAGAIARPAAAFVTLRRDAHLRGCIGHLELDRPLAAVVARAAVAAALEDPRFPPVTPAELDAVTIEISVLGPMRRVLDWSAIEVGRHGLVVQSGRARGLLLPQVAVEWRWDVETFLGQTCLKAGLGADAWRTGAEILCFEADVFGEKDV
jgi:AmmeMemoRadiSam system protein A